MAVENDEQFGAWLEGQSQEVCTAIAVRAALRVVSLVCSVETGSEHHEKLALWTFRAILTSGVAAVGPTPDVRAAAGAAADAARAAVGAAADAAYAAAGAPARASYAAARAAYAAARAAGAASGAAYAAVRAAAYADTTLPAEPRRILENSVQDLQAITDSTKEMRQKDGRIWVLTAGGDWEFWGRWYERAMQGQARDWKLYEQIVTEIPDDVWTGKNAVAEVAAEIARLEANYFGKPKDSEVLRSQAQRLQSAPQITEGVTTWVADEIERAISQYMQLNNCNSLPDGMDALLGLPSLLRKIAVSSADSSQFDALQDEIRQLRTTVAQLTIELEAAQKESRKKLVVNTVLLTSVTLLTTTFYQSISGGIAYATGIEGFADILERFSNIGEMMPAPVEAPELPPAIDL